MINGQKKKVVRIGLSERREEPEEEVVEGYIAGIRRLCERRMDCGGLLVLGWTVRKSMRMASKRNTCWFAIWWGRRVLMRASFPADPRSGY